MSHIPINNLFYLLSYAWDLLSEGDAAPISIDDTRSTPDMLALMLAGGIESLGRRGLFKDYQPRVEDTPRLKGRIDFVASVRQLSHRKVSLVCHFDELGTDNLVNGILRSTLDRLLGSSTINTTVKHRLWDTASVLQHVPGVVMRRGCFQRAVVTRHHRAYRMALLVCELLFELAQPDASGKSYQFVDPWTDKGMPRLFEAFVRNFLRCHLTNATVKAQHLEWDAQGDTAEAQAILPIMKTDVTIEWGNERCVILDCKFYENSFTQSFDKTKLKSSNLYQISAYLHHHPFRSKGAMMHGVLLYPAVNTDFLHYYDFLGHRLTVASLDLSQTWQSIHDRLLLIVNT